MTQADHMQCPRCAGSHLAPVITRQGVEVDHCDECGGVWLDKGEIFYFAKNPKPLVAEIQRATKAAQPGTLASPKTGKPMRTMRLFDEIEVDLCPDTKGIWFDHGELKDILRRAGKIQLEVDETAAKPSIGAALPTPARLAAYAAAAKPLPNLWLRSVSILGVLYGLLTLLLMFVVEMGGLTPLGALVIGLVIAGLQFGLGPIMMDWSLRWFYQCHFVDPGELPEHLRVFVERVSREHKIKFPRMGIIDDGAPNAFTYGHVPSNARIVVTRGLMGMLDERELEAVVAHEMGHAVQWDMVIMTMAYLVPLICYYIYRTLIRIRVRGKDNTAAARYAIALGAFAIYLISEYIVLWLSRTREYKADAFAGRVTGEPAALARGLVKIGYGLAGQVSEKERKAQQARGATAPARRGNLEALGAMGIFDGGAARAMAVAAVGRTGTTSLDGEALRGAMRWDLWNPWAKFYELGSTHPLIAHRLDYLGRQSAKMGQEPLVVFDEVRPESYWDEFLVDVLVMFLPLLLGVAPVVLGVLADEPRWMVLGVSGLGLGMLLKTLFSYRGGAYPEMTVASLLKKVKVSAVRGVPVTVQGTVIGRGVPGLIWSEDFVMRDETGILFLDYRQPLRFLEFLFGLMRRSQLDNAEVVATGWYRRSPVPYLELRSLQGAGKTRHCYTRHAKLFFAGLLIAGGLFWLASGSF